MSNSLASESINKTAASSFLPWLVCLSAGLFFFYEFFQLNVFDVINQDLRKNFALDAAGVSWMSSSFVWANVLFLLPAGVIFDCLPAKKVIITALLVCVIGTLGFALTNSYLYATVFHAFAGIGNAFCFLSCVVLVTRWFPPQKQALVIGLIVTMAFIGGMAAHTPFAYLNTKLGFRNALLIDAGFGVIILLLIYIFVQDKNIKPTKLSPSSLGWFTKFTQSLTNKQTWLAGLYTACLNLPIMVLCALWGGSYLISIHHLDQITASNIISLIFIGSIIGCPVLGWASDHQGKRKPTMLFGAILTLLLFIPLIFGNTLSSIMLSLIFLSLGFVTSAQIISYPLIAESNPLSNTGIATGIASVIIMSGGGLGQILFGLIMNRGAASLECSASNYQNAMLIFPASALIALVAVLLMKETNCARQKSVN